LLGRIKNIRKFQIYTKEINLKADVKRFWLETLKSIREDRYFNSAPLDVNFLDGLYYANEYNNMTIQSEL